MQPGDTGRKLATQGADAERELWTVADFCAAHGLSKTTVYSLLSASRLQGVRVGNRTLITEASRQAWLASLPAYRPRETPICGATV